MGSWTLPPLVAKLGSVSACRCCRGVLVEAALADALSTPPATRRCCLRYYIEPSVSFSWPSTTTGITAVHCARGERIEFYSAKSTVTLTALTCFAILWQPAAAFRLTALCASASSGSLRALRLYALMLARPAAPSAVFLGQCAPRRRTCPVFRSESPGGPQRVLPPLRNQANVDELVRKQRTVGVIEHRLEFGCSG